jgi:hypothetical protein
MSVRQANRGKADAPKAAPTEMREGTWSALVSSSDLWVMIVRIDSTMTTRFTAPILCVVSRLPQYVFPSHLQET